jgi:peptide chain release factor subunit 1
MATSVTWQTLRDLAGFHAEHGSALSLYLDLDPSTSPTPSDIETHFQSLVDKVDKTSGADVERLQRWWQEEYERDGARAFAVFTSAEDDFFRAFPLTVGVRDHVAVGGDLELAPLLGQLGGHEGALVAVVGRELGVLYRLRGGRLEEVADETDDVEGQHSQGGWSQARYQRHVEQVVREHLDAVGEQIDRRVRRARGPKLVVVAPEELRSEIEAALATETQEAIVGWTTAEAHASPDELLELARPYLDQAIASEEQDALERWHEAVGKGERGSAGWHDTLEAASDARVEELLLADTVEPRIAYRCPTDGRAYAEPGTCPLDGATLEEHDGVELAVHHTLANGGTILSVGGDPLGGEGIGALLRF